MKMIRVIKLVRASMTDPEKGYVRTKAMINPAFLLYAEAVKLEKPLLDPKDPKTTDATYLQLSFGNMTVAMPFNEFREKVEAADVTASNL